jgi:DNA-binding transcriptional MerR regulator
MQIAHPAEELLTTADAARIAGVVPDTFRLWQRLGKVAPAFITPTRIRLYRRSDVERLVEQRLALVGDAGGVR